MAARSREISLIEEFYFQKTIKRGDISDDFECEEYVNQFKSFLVEKLNITNFGKKSSNKPLKRLIKFVKNGGIYYPSKFTEIIKSKLIPKTKVYRGTLFGNESGKSSLIEYFLFNKVPEYWELGVGKFISHYFSINNP